MKTTKTAAVVSAKPVAKRVAAKKVIKPVSAIAAFVASAPAVKAPVVAKAPAAKKIETAKIIKPVINKGTTFDFFLADNPYGRIGQGNKLFAFTFAWLTLSGLMDGGEIAESTARKVAGDTAVSYHLNKSGHFIKNNGMLALSPTGLIHFAPNNPKRPVDMKLAETYGNILISGKADGVHVHQVNVRKLAA